MSNTPKSQKVFTIDGSYFFHRALGSLNMKTNVNNLLTKPEQDAFNNCCITSLLNIWDIVSKHFDNMIFVTDKHSWRKDVEPVKPYYILEAEAKLNHDESVGIIIDENSRELLGYKEQRVNKKNESTIDYDMFYNLCDKFIAEVLKPNMVVFDIHGLEGDDNIMLLSQYFKNLGKDNADILNCIFCTDGDLIQTVNTNNILFRNIRSKAVLYGEFVVNLKMYESVFESSKTTQLLGGTFSGPAYYNKLFAMTLIGVRAKRTINAGINIAQPFKIALVKSICGDKKDNIFPIFRWIKNGKNFKCTEKMLEKALKLDTQYLTESTAISYLTDKNLLMNLLTNLRDIVKQPDVDLVNVAKHLKHNLHLIVLTPKNIPSTYVDEFNTVLAKHEHAILFDTFDPKFLSNIKITINDNATNIMSESIPDNLL